MKTANAKDLKTTDGRPSYCIFDNTELKDWIERNSNLYVRFSTVCKCCASIYVSNLNRVSRETANYVHKPGAEGWRCIGCNKGLLRVTVATEVMGLLDFMRQSPKTVSVPVMRCPGCGTSSTERMEPVMLR